MGCAEVNSPVGRRFPTNYRAGQVEPAGLQKRRFVGQTKIDPTPYDPIFSMSLANAVPRLRASKYADLLRPPYRYVRRLAKAVLGLDHWIRKDVSIPRERLGNDWADWVVATKLFSGAKTVVYSFGLGRDISFEHALAKRFGCTIFGFDPTPVSLDYLMARPLPARMEIVPWGLGTEDGNKDFGLPAPGDVNFSASKSNGESVELEVRKLSTIMKTFGHDRLDVLKIDVEGAEFECIPQILAEGILPVQFFVEFHHGFFGIPVARTRNALAELKRAGYLIFDVSPVGREISLIHRSALGLAS